MSKTESNIDVLIAGAGPAGLMLPANWPCILFHSELLTKTSPVICSGALIIHARTLEIFSTAGAGRKSYQSRDNCPKFKYSF